MTKKLILPSLFMLIGQLILGQDSINNKTWYKKINQAFGTVSTGQADAANLANFGSFEPLNGSFKLNFFGPLRSTDSSKAPFFNISAEGKITGNNIGVLFSNSKLNTGTNITGKLHFPITSVIHTSGNQAAAIDEQIRMLEIEKARKKLQTALNGDSSLFTNQYRHDTATFSVLNRQLRQIRVEWMQLNEGISKTDPNDSQNLVQLTERSGKKAEELQKLILDSAILHSRIDSLKELVDSPLVAKEKINALNYKIDTDTKKKRDSIEMSITVVGTEMCWVSIVGSWGRNKYYTLFDELPFSTQFDDIKLATYQVGAELNFIRFTGKSTSIVGGKMPGIHIGNIGIAWTHNNDLNRFTTSEMTNSKKYVSGDSTRTVATKYNVYSKKISEYDALRVYLNYYWLFGKKRNMAIHFYPDVEFRDTDENPFKDAREHIEKGHFIDYDIKISA